MKIIETKLKGAYIIEPERLEDERGFFARTFCQKEFEANGLNPRIVQCSISYNKHKGTLRGMHYQASPMAEAKLVRCTRGAIYDVIIDLRQESPTCNKWIAVELNADNRRLLYIPEGLAHGFQTLEDDTEIFYHMSEFYVPEQARGLRWNDPFFGIKWPIEQPIISQKDMLYENFKGNVGIKFDTQKMKEMIFWGATGQAKVLKDCMKDYGLNLVAMFDNNKNLLSPYEDIPLYFGRKGFEEWLAKRDVNEPVGFLVAIGGDKGKDRIEIQEYLESHGLIALIAKHPSAFIADNAKIDAGSQILANSSVCVDTMIGRGCIINTGAIVDHECRIDDGVHICPGAHLAGSVEVGRYSTIYTGAVILPRIKIGEGAIVGAGAIVIEDVPPYTMVVGNPAKILRKLN